ncbi:hypothetical protein [Lysinibacillus pakistanensis]|uniref:Uncharacterized protein n=1 Tax=Lysinibacillus pakistanensis TaxID=759811 RepID=A0AAX3WYT9_9BACI|nr:hypothetical protein [Lysinibacillus pakistanensis]MDM5232379.1 hypothetical protein [Lysinibacillus pakistanensis]QGG50547.1 hypothetical protein GDS87_06110 [Lysinibacillus pakistanensis]WHY47893.1 hypothetical protein QNH22_06610 [Lysinibacillus pakistanensis]WHY52905.1 hypothetical protein QNH24_06595 [Lysinibacillus pakistanensis]
METHFTYKQFVTNHSFSLLDPIFEVILLFAIILLLIVFIKNVPTWFCLLFAGLSILISGQLLWFSGIIADELNIGGSAKSFFIFIATLCIHGAAIWISLIKSSKDEKIPQHSEGF